MEREARQWEKKKVLYKVGGAGIHSPPSGDLHELQSLQHVGAFAKNERHKGGFNHDLLTEWAYV